MSNKTHMFMNPPAPSYLKVDYRTYMTRLYFGWEKRLAATTAKTVKSCKGLNQKAIDFNLTPFITVKAMCDYHGVSTSTFYRRKSKGLSLEQCLSKLGRCVV